MLRKILKTLDKIKMKRNYQKTVKKKLMNSLRNFKISIILEKTENDFKL